MFKIDGIEPHGVPAGKILGEELEAESRAHGTDVECGFETEADDCEAFDVDVAGKTDLSGVCVLLACTVENAGDDKS